MTTKAQTRLGIHTKYIVIGQGYWGGGPTLLQAKKQYQKAGGLKKDIKTIYRFTSECPFVVGKDHANDEQADAYVSFDGTLCWTANATRERYNEDLEAAIKTLAAFSKEEGYLRVTCYADGSYICER